MKFISLKVATFLLVLFSASSVIAEGTNNERWSYFSRVSSTGDVKESFFSSTITPNVGDTITVAKDVAVRKTPPSIGNTLGAKVDALATGTQVKVVSVKTFSGTENSTLVWVSTETVK